VALKPSTSYIETVRKGAFGTDDRTQFQLVRSGGCQQPGQETGAGADGAAEALVTPAAVAASATAAPAASLRMRREEIAENGVNTGCLHRDQVADRKLVGTVQVPTRSL